MEASIDRAGTVAGLEKVLAAATSGSGGGGVLLLSCDGNGFTPDAVASVLRRVEAVVVGAIFPAVFAGAELLERGTIAISLPTVPRVLTLASEGLDDGALRQTLVNSDLDPRHTVLVLTDGLAFHANALLDALFDVFGLEPKYLGGGAGSLTLQRRPCLITNQGLTARDALIVAIDLPCGIGVAHGHTKVGGPHQITSASGHVVHTIDWRPAAGRFRELVRAHLAPGEDDAGGVVSRSFCLALNRLGGDVVVREAVRVQDDGGLEFATQMRENELVDIVRADRDRMLAAPVAARQAAHGDLGTDPQTNLCFTCCARRIFLGDDFRLEMQALQRHGVALFGAVTVGGEIANNGESYLDYFNRTCVVGAFGV